MTEGISGSWSSTGSNPNVLVVEDEEDVAALYADWLKETCSVTLAHNGEAALGRITDNVDIVLLDRQMPGVSGDDVLERIRRDGFDARVAMVTAVDPDFDIIDMGFDDYLVKPVAEDELLTTVNQMMLRSTYSEQVQELFSLASKKAVLRKQKTDAELRASEDYARLEDRIAVLRADIDGVIDSLNDEKLTAVLS